MIRFDSITAKDFGGHRSFKHKISGNVLGLSGVSGAGKSTILQIFEWLAVGRIDHKNRPITTWVRRSATDDVKKTEASGVLTIDGKPLTIARSASLAGTATRAIVWDGKKPITAAEAAEDLLVSLFGASMKTISALVFIRQGSFGLLFSGLDSARREFFVRLLALGHLEKIGGIVDTYRKQMMGSVQDLSAVRDAAETAYQEQQAHFEEADALLSRTKSYTKEIDAGVNLSGVLDRLADKEVVKQRHETALTEGLAALGLPPAGYPAWLAATDAQLDGLRTALQRAQNQQKARRTYAETAASTEGWLAAARAWLDKKTRADALQRQIDEVVEDARKPDPRDRIWWVDTWTKAYAQKAEAELARPAAQEAMYKLADEEVAVAGRHGDANAAVFKTGAAWQKAKADLKDAEELKAAVAHASDGQQCKACGNEHPDPKFLDSVIANTAELVAKLQAERDHTSVKLQAAAVACQVIGNKVRDAQDALREVDSKLAAANASLAGAPPQEGLAAEKETLTAAIPAFDAARGKHMLLTRQLSEIDLGPTAYTTDEVTKQEASLALTAQMLAVFPSAEELDTTARSLTEEGVALKTQRDRLARLGEDADAASRAYEAQWAVLQAQTDNLSVAVPFLASSLAALGVITAATVAQVLAGLRDRQTQHDSQTGQVDAARRTMHEGGARLQEIEVRIAEQLNRIVIGKELEAVRAAFIPTGITTDYIAHQFSRIAVVTQDHLAQMGADFMVVASEERALSFDYLRLNEAGGAWLDQDSMSGGQQVKLAIAIVLAIHELIIPQVGLLVLDEPSTHLDLDSRVALADVLKEIGARGNFQLIVCDHSPELKDAYTDTIELSADPE